MKAPTWAANHQSLSFGMATISVSKYGERERAHSPHLFLSPARPLESLLILPVLWRQLP
jgi:hypothetical protein